MRTLSARSTLIFLALLSLLACGGGTTDVPPIDDGSPPPPPLRGQLFAFVDVNVIPMGDVEQVLTGHTVLVEDDRIVALGPDGSVSIDGATVMQGAGRYLIPGLIDMHVHSISSVREEREQDNLLFLANGVTTIRVMWGSLPILEERSRVEDGEVLGPTHLVASQGLDGPGGPWSAPPVTSTDQARQRVEQHVAAGYDYIKVYNSLAPDVYQSIISTARRQGIPVVGHVPFNVGIEAVQNARQRTLEHFIGIRAAASTPATGGVLDLARVQELAARSATAGLWHTPTTTVDGLSVADVARIQASPELNLVSRGMRQFFQDGFHNGLPVAVADKERANHLTITRAIFDAGGRLLVGTDAGFGWMIPGFSIHDELGSFIDAGIPPFETLRAATSHAAIAASRENDLGRIAAGVQADIVLLDGNPLQDLSVLRVPAGVMVRGRWLTAAELQALITS